MRNFYINQLKQYVYLMRLHKPVGIFLLLWPTLWALWLAGSGAPNSHIVIIFILGVIVMRGAGCIINDIADRHYDKYVERTKNRPLTAGNVTLSEALILFIILSGVAFLLVLQLNFQTILLSLGGVIIAIFYPFMKRFTHLPQLGLGVAFAFSVPMAFMALVENMPTRAWWLFLVSILWPVIYDTMYAMVDRVDDVKIGVKSSAILFGQYDRQVIVFLQCIFYASLFQLGRLFHLQWPYYLSLIVVGLLLSYQLWLIKDRLSENCFRAFLNNQWVGLVVFIGIFLSYSI